MNELLVQGGAFGIVAAIALGLIRLLEKAWDKRNGRSNLNGVGIVMTKIEASLDSMTQFHHELVQDLRDVRDNQERIKGGLTKLQGDSNYLRSWHEKTEDGRIAAYYPQERSEAQHKESMDTLRDIANSLKAT